MIKAMIIALLAATWLVVGAQKSPKLTRQIRKSTLGGYVVAIDDNLFILSRVSGNKSLILVSPREEILYKPCTIHLNESFDGQIKAVTLWRKFVIWNSSPVRDYYTFLLIDPRTCAHKTLAKLKPISLDKPQVVVYKDRLDIFCPSQLACMPCTFDINGNKLDAPYQLQYRRQFRIRTIGQTSRRYVFVYDDNGQAQLELLNERFGKMYGYYYENGRIVEDFAVNSVSSKSFAGIVIMLSTNSSKRAYYSSLRDSNLEDVFGRYLPEFGGHTLERAYVNIDSQGNSYVTLVQSEDQSSNAIVTLVIYDVNGNLVDEILLVKRHFQEDKYYWDEHPILIDDGEYCLCEQMRQEYPIPTEITRIKCINIRRN